MKRGSIIGLLIAISILLISIGFASSLELNKPTMLTILNKTTWELKAVKDFNNDSIPDLLFQKKSNSNLAIWLMDSNVAKNNTLTLPKIGLLWKLKFVKDLDNDGVADLIGQHSISGKVAVWFMNSNGTQKSANSLLDKTTWKLSYAEDFNNDKIADLIFQHPVSGKISILFMNSDGTKNNTLTFPTANLLWKLKFLKDLDDDGISDLIFQHKITGKLAVWFMNSNGTQKSTKVITDKTTWELIAVKDFNNDSISDLLFQKPSNGNLAIWFMNSDGTQNSTFVLPKVNLLWKIKAIEDLDNNGVPDLLFQHQTTNKVVAWLMSYNITLPQPTEIICTSFNYSTLSNCSNGIQTRVVVSSSPNGCVNGNPQISQTCEDADSLEELINEETNITEESETLQDEETPTTPTTPTNNQTYYQTNDTVTELDYGVTCQQLGASLGYLSENLICICPSCEITPPTVCSRLGYNDLPGSNDCIYCCGRTRG